MASATSQPNASSQPAASSTASNELVKPTGPNLDMGWEWNSLKDIKNKKSVTCDFCGKTSNGGITRAKKHQMGLKGEVGPCLKIPADVKQKLRDAFELKNAVKHAAMDEGFLDEAEEEDMAEMRALRRGKRPATTNIFGAPAAKSDTAAKSNSKGSLDEFLWQAPETTIKVTESRWRQSSIKDCEKQARDKCIQYIARCFYRNGIPFNVTRTRSYKLMIEAIGNYGKHLKPPSYHEMRVPLLARELEHTNKMLEGFDRERAEYGCSIMSDAWTDRKNRTLINFLVNSPRGSVFVRSVDGSAYCKTGAKVYELLETFIAEIGVDNVVQVVTDNGSNYKMAGGMIEQNYPHIFWTPCAAHCVDLMLEDIGKQVKVKRAIGRGQFIVNFIYNHTMALNIMRKFTGKMELVRSGVTRFATTFLTLQRLHNQQNALRKMFLSDEWSSTKIAKESKGKKVRDYVIMPSFWNDVVYSLKAMGPLVQVLRLVDNEKMPAMGYIYEAMDRAKELIATSFQNNQAKYADIFAIIDKRWECQLHHPLHAAGHYLNPKHFYNDPSIGRDREVRDGLYATIERLSKDPESNDEAICNLAIYRNADGMFGKASAIRMRTTMSPAEWWSAYGLDVPILQTIAIKVLSLTCSSSGCERNWSAFEQIHSKKRSKLEHQKLQDLVYVKYNQTLRERYDSKDLIDPIALDHIDDCNEWLVKELGGDGEGAEQEGVFGDDGLTWGDVADATGVSEPARLTRHLTRLTTVAEEDEAEEHIIDSSDEKEEQQLGVEVDESDSD